MANTPAYLSAIITLNNSKFKRGINDSKSVMGRFKKQIGTIGPAIAAAFSVAAISNFVKSSLEAYDKQAKAEKQLLTALNGRADAQQRLMAQASYLQKQTLFGDEETIRAQALIAAFVKEEEQIRKITPLVQDLAAAKGMDLAGAADLVSKTLGSSTNALSRYGIQVEGTVGSTERLESLMKGLNSAFGGQAEAMAEAGIGSFQQLQNAIGDLKEGVGELINMPLANWFSDMADALDVATDKQISFGDKLLGVFNPSVKMANRAIADLNDATAEFNIVTDPAEKLLARVAADHAAAAEAAVKHAEAQRKLNEAKAEELEKFFSFDKNDAFQEAMQSRVRVTQELSEQVQVAADSNIAAYESEIAALLKMEPAFENVKGVMIEVQKEGSKLNEQIAQMAVQIGSSLATSLGQAAAGAKSFEETLAEMGVMIANALGDILIMVGMSTSPIGVPLILAGLALKGFAGFAGAGGFGEQQRVQAGYGFTQQSESRIYGNDIKTANDYATNLYNRVG